MVYNGYYKVMSNSPKMGHLPTPDSWVFLMARRFPPSGPGFVSLVTEVVHAQARLEQVFDLGSAGSGHRGGGWDSQVGLGTNDEMFGKMWGNSWRVMVFMV